MKKAVVYYSLSDNTKEAAEYIAEKIGADLFRIEPVRPMPDSFPKQILLGGMQASLGLCPKIKGIPETIGSYDEIILGTPIWAGKAASPVNTLLKKYHAADRITAVFTFSGGGDNETCIAALSKKLKNLKGNVALADRKSETSEQNREKLEKFTDSLR